ncbi:MAG: hypothetical protein QOK88_08490 [Nitrososphaeraceae archaeon]|jgi:hypothetical protein|nr:hypothetical protein [Nitrososphaeraceae archaeon]MDW0135520.1 hypothetical protein [Nitrososphaeraceae archaeon]MDW0156245.1 hypothetical protein [Nitrososphaeraceae archaeon]
MEKSNGIKIGVIVATLSLLFCSSVIIQISSAEEVELKSVGKGNISCQSGEEIKNVRINFIVSFDKGTSFAEWNIDHEEFGSAGGIITSIQASSESFSLKGFEAFDNICDNETPSDMKLSGHCGPGTVKLVSDNGNKGTFTSNVKCG